MRSEDALDAAYGEVGSSGWSSLEDPFSTDP